MRITAQKLADSLGVSKETVRHYRELGLLHPVLRENGYYDYSERDALSLLLAKEMRAYDMSLENARNWFGQSTMAQYNGFLEERERSLLQQLNRLQLELSRMQETRIYASCGVRLLGKVEEFEGPPTWAVGALSNESGFMLDRQLGKWMEHLPFTYVSATITLKELQEKTGNEAYHIEIGLGALIHYVKAFDLPLHESAHYQPGGHFIRTCITTRDIFSISPRDVAPLRDYAAAQHYAFATCTGGRLLFIENADDQPLYYVLVWVGVEQSHGGSP